MAARGHNKKRNSGLLYEFLVRRISTALVEKDARTQAAALRLIKRHFKPGSELHRELRLIRSLVQTTVSTPAVAASIIGEARVAARTFDQARLDEEKSRLLREISRTLHDESFFEVQVDEYKAYATVQTLVNEWRAPRGTVDIGRLAQYEDALVRRLTTERAAPDDRLVNEESPGTNRLAAHIMMRRLNEKYAGSLDSTQRELVRAYVFAAGRGDGTGLRAKFEQARTALIETLDRFRNERHSTDAASTLEKVQGLRSRLAEENLEKIDDESVARFLACFRVKAEIEGTAASIVEGAGSQIHESAEPRLLISSPEYIEQPSVMVRESIEKNGGRIILSGILQKADTLNQNGRVYPRAILEREIRNYQKFINERRATGELDHPDSSVISLKNVSHKVIEAVMDGNIVRGKVELLNTPSGKILQDLLEGDVKLGISSRGVGSTKKKGDYVVVEEDFQLICWDFVSEPSTPGAFMLPEGRRVAEGRALTRIERVDRLMGELLIR